MTNLRFRPAVLSLPRYKPSKSAPDAVKISSNEMPTPPSPAVLEAIARELQTINRYPDLTAAPLRQALGSRFGVGGSRGVGCFQSHGETELGALERCTNGGKLSIGRLKLLQQAGLSGQQTGFLSDEILILLRSGRGLGHASPE